MHEPLHPDMMWTIWARACRPWRRGTALTTMIWCVIGLAPAQALEHVVFERDGKQREVEGRVLVSSQDGGMMLEARDGTIWPITGPQVKKREHDDRPFEYFSADELAAHVLSELPAGFQVYQTAHYVICYNTSNGYAQWCGALYERLHRAFQNYWRHRRLDLHDPPPLVAIVFRDKQSYEQYGRPEVGEGIESIIGYYSLQSNRIASYDLTGLQTAYAGAHQPASIAGINRVLATRGGERTVATLIHEATHQLAFNCGLQSRFADIPLWFNEGLAIYFETPDLQSTKGWRTIGGVNQYRLAQFLRYCHHRPTNSLISLLINDQRFRSSAQAEEAYAEAWAFCYFLIRTRSREFSEYMELMQQKSPLDRSTPEQRLSEFRAIFGEDLERLDDEFLRYMFRAR